MIFSSMGGDAIGWKLNEFRSVGRALRWKGGTKQKKKEKARLL